MEKKTAYVVCCEPRVILFGYADEADRTAIPPRLHRVRMLVYYDQATRGVHGAAANGPTSGCRVTPAATLQTIDSKIEAWITCSEQAVARWELEPWA